MRLRQEGTMAESQSRDKDYSGRPVIVDANGHYLSIHKHVVDPDGTVHGPPGENSSVVCPVPGCGWHEFVKLEGWSGEM
jgi:hypothetical protein